MRPAVIVKIPGIVNARMVLRGQCTMHAISRDCEIISKSPPLLSYIQSEMVVSVFTYRENECDGVSERKKDEEEREERREGQGEREEQGEACSHAAGSSSSAGPCTGHTVSLNTRESTRMHVRKRKHMHV